VAQRDVQGQVSYSEGHLGQVSTLLAETSPPRVARLAGFLYLLVIVFGMFAELFVGLRLTTIGRRTGRERNVMVGYFEDGPDLVTMAMNGWGEGEPAWWLNLQAHPDVRLDLVDGPRSVAGRAAQDAERERLWTRWQEIDKNLDAYAARRSTETAVVILEPRLES
jgi:deazaflavin-dependent oxidoreductase (nitroreductase family)